MNFLLTTAIAILFFGSYFVSDSFAVNYRDSTGYTPSWAISSGMYSALDTCLDLSGDTSRDGNWCLEWTLYVLDQGVDNFSMENESYNNYIPSEQTTTSTTKEIHSFDIDYPTSWHSFSAEGLGVLALVRASDSIREENDGAITIGKMNGKLPVNDFATLTAMTNSIENNCVSQDRTKCDKFVLVTSEIVTINQKPTYYVKYTSLVSGYPTTTWIMSIPDGEQVWAVAAKSIKPTKWTNAIEESIKSFKIITTTSSANTVQKITSSNSDSINIVPSAFAETFVVKIPKGTKFPGCEKTNQCFNPYLTHISVGDTVTWENKDSAAHTITSGDPTHGPDGLFDSGLIMPETSFTITFDSSQITAYFCMVHPWQQGIVRVTDGTSTDIPEETSLTESTQTTETQKAETQKVIVNTKIIRNPELETVSSLQQKISKVLNNAEYTLDGPTVIPLDDGSKKTGYTIINPEGKSFGSVNIWSKNNYVIELELGTTHNNDFDSASIAAIALAGLIKKVVDPNEFDIDDFTEMYAEAAEDLDYETDSIRTTPNGSKIKVGYITILEGVPGLTVVTFDIKYKENITVTSTQVSDNPPPVRDTPKTETAPIGKNEDDKLPKTTSESNSGNAALGALMIFGVPVFLIGLFMVRRKMKKAKLQKIKDAEWGGV